MLLEYLKSNYAPGEPIFLADIDVELSDANIRYHLKTLVDKGQLRRYDSGVYYFPKTSRLLKQELPLSADAVMYNKYILRRGKRVGYYSGYTLVNDMGMTTQVPFVEEVTSNYAPAPVREIMIGKRKFLLRRPVTEVTEKNVALLQFLDTLKELDNCAELDPKACGKILSDFAIKHSITKEAVDLLIEKYPVKIYKAIYDTEVKYVSA